MTDQDDAKAAAAAQRKSLVDALQVELEYAQHPGFARPAEDVAGIRAALADLGVDDDAADHSPREQATPGRRGRTTRKA